MLASVSIAQESGDAFREYGDGVSKAVDRGCQYLLSVEQKDGTFPGAYGWSTGISSLVGMCFLANGQTPANGRYSEAINRRIDYALRHTKGDGLIDSGDHGNGPMYAHIISTLFLADCSGKVDAVRQKKMDEVLPGAINLLLRAQAVKKDERQQGGWRYHSNSTDSDLSSSAWGLMALHAAKLRGVPVPPAAIEAAVKYVHRNFERKLGHFGYMDAYSMKESLTGAGLLCLELCGVKGGPENLKAGEWILKNHTELPRRAEFEFQGNYFNALGMFHLGNKYWSVYAGWMYPHYLKQQQRDGSWKDGRFGKVYGTTMQLLAFTVPARQLLTFRREEQVKEQKPESGQKPPEQNK